MFFLTEKLMVLFQDVNMQVFIIPRDLM